MLEGKRGEENWKRKAYKSTVWAILRRRFNEINLSKCKQSENQLPVSIYCLSYFDWLITISIDSKHNKQILVFFSIFPRSYSILRWERNTVRIKSIEVNKWPKSNGKYLKPIYFMNKSIDKRKHNVRHIDWMVCILGFIITNSGHINPQ